MKLQHTPGLTDIALDHFDVVAGCFLPALGLPLDHVRRCDVAAFAACFAAWPEEAAHCGQSQCNAQLFLDQFCDNGAGPQVGIKSILLRILALNPGVNASLLFVSKLGAWSDCFATFEGRSAAFVIGTQPAIDRRPAQPQGFHDFAGSFFVLADSSHGENSKVFASPVIQCASVDFWHVLIMHFYLIVVYPKDLKVKKCDFVLASSRNLSKVILVGLPLFFP